MDTDLIESFLPDYDVRAVYNIHVNAPMPVVYQAVRWLNLSHSRSVRWLVRMRGMPAFATTRAGAQSNWVRLI